MNKKIEAIVKEGILGLLEEYYDWYGELNEKAEFVFSTLFKDDEFNLSEQGNRAVEFLISSISESCTKEEIDLAYNCAITKEEELNENFYNILPKMYVNIITKIKDKALKDEEQVAYMVIDYLGKQTLGLKEFTRQVKENLNNITQPEK